MPVSADAAPREVLHDDAIARGLYCDTAHAGGTILRKTRHRILDLVGVFGLGVLPAFSKVQLGGAVSTAMSSSKGTGAPAASTSELPALSVM